MLGYIRYQIEIYQSFTISIPLKSALPLISITDLSINNYWLLLILTTPIKSLKPLYLSVVTQSSRFINNSSCHIHNINHYIYRQSLSNPLYISVSDLLISQITWIILKIKSTIHQYPVIRSTSAFQIINHS